MTIPGSLKSRKLWLTIGGFVSTLGAWFTGEVSAAQALIAIVTIITGYNTANVIESRTTALSSRVDKQPSPTITDVPA